LNWVDLSVIAILAISALLAFLRGFVREVLGIGAWVGAAFISVKAYDAVLPKFQEWIPNPDFSGPAAYAAVFLVALILLSVLAGMVGGIVRMSLLGGIDRTLGVVFGLVRGAALIAVAYILGGMVMEVGRWPDPVLKARTLPYAYAGAAWAASLLPEDFRPNVQPPPAGREARAEDLLHATPQGRATGRP
jgi:membrane protein required for colicin V production